jgi:hypothetical protein
MQTIPVLRQVDLTGKLVTSDALFTQRAICDHILAQGGHYLFEVKDNQATLLADVSRPFRTRSTRWTGRRPAPVACADTGCFAPEEDLGLFAGCPHDASPDANWV